MFCGKALSMPGVVLQMISPNNLSINKDHIDVTDKILIQNIFIIDISINFGCHYVPTCTILHTSHQSNNICLYNKQYKCTNQKMA